MKIVRYASAAGGRVGVLDDGSPDILGVARASEGGVDDLETVIALGAVGLQRLARLAQSPVERVPLAEARLICPLTRPRKILAIGLNYQEHIEESGMAAGARQLWFNKQVTALNGPFDGVEKPDVSDYLDYEGELCVVIGRGGRRIPRDRALDAVFGYCIGNDVSVRDWQMATPTMTMGKSFDTHAPVGPWITTADDVPDPQALTLRTRVNGEIRQEASTAAMRHPIADQIAHLSEAFTLEPGDLLFTGTPAGVGGAMKPPRFLEVGDIVRVEIDTLGAIENQVIAQALSQQAGEDP
ncbi:fumarylacetoacetate hydrolase family protein [Thermaurantiacus sp.]